MKCYCEERDGRFLYIVEDVPEAYREALEIAWFKLQDGCFIKNVYAAAIPDKALVSANFARLGPDQFRSGGTSWRTALECFHHLAAEHGIGYILTGSASVAIRGIDITPNDLDILVDEQDFWKARELFADNLIEPMMDYGDALWLVRYSGRLCLEETRIDINAGPKPLLRLGEVETVNWNGLSIRAQSLAACLEHYRTENRTGRVEAIETYLKN